jgi:hypothetical protein
LSANKNDFINKIIRSLALKDKEPNKDKSKKSSKDKKKDFKAVFMFSTSYGKVYGETFVGTAAIAGCMYDWKVSKRYQIKLMGLYVYSPYVSYFNDMLLKSQHVIIPIIGTNIGITKRFKININTGGAWAIADNALNYTVMMGTRLML